MIKPLVPDLILIAVKLFNILQNKEKSERLIQICVFLIIIIIFSFFSH